MLVHTRPARMCIRTSTGTCVYADAAHRRERVRAMQRACEHVHALSCSCAKRGRGVIERTRRKARGAQTTSAEDTPGQGRDRYIPANGEDPNQIGGKQLLNCRKADARER
eukprot:6199250-Pleurochrysis_carterae.AAC.1